MRTKRLQVRVLAILFAMLVLFSQVTEVAYAENKVVSEEIISEAILELETATVDSEAVKLQDFLWPNDNKQYSYTIDNTIAGNRYLLMVIQGVHKTLEGIEKDELISSILYIDQKTATENTLTFTGFIPALEGNSTVVISGEGMVPTIAGYFSKDIYRFGIFNDASCTTALLDNWVVERNTTWQDFKEKLPKTAYVEIYSDYMDPLYCPVNLEWRDCEDFDTTKKETKYHIIADVSAKENSAVGGFAELLKPFEATVTVTNEVTMPIDISVSKNAVLYHVNEKISVEDLNVKAYYSDGTVRSITGWTTNIDSLSTAKEGILYLTVSYQYEGLELSDTIEIFVVAEDSQDLVVTYETFGGSNIAPSLVKKGEKLELPAEPIKKGFVFTGWSTSKYEVIPFDSQSSIQKSMALYATWMSEVQTVVDSLEVKLDTYNLFLGEKLNADQIKVYANYSDGSQKLVEQFSSNLEEIDQGVAGTKTLKVSYTENGITKETQVEFRLIEGQENELYQVTFITGCEEMQEFTQMVVAGDTLVLPNVMPKREGYVFAGWFHGKKQWDFTKDKVTDNVVLTAKWLKYYSDKFSCMIEEIPDCEYTGKPIKPDLVVMDDSFNLLKSGKDYSVKYMNNVLPSNSKSEAKILITGKGNYQGSIEVPFKILPKNLDGLDVLFNIPQTSYANLKAAKYEPVVKACGKTLKKNVDYTLKYKKWNGIDEETAQIYKKNEFDKAGNYLAVVEGIGNYTGQKNLPFTVVDTSMKSLSSAKIKIDKNLSKVFYNGQDIKINSGVLVSMGKDTLKEGVDYEIIYPDDICNVGKKDILIQALPGSKRCFGAKKASYEIVGIPMKQTQVVLKKDRVDFNSSLISDNVSYVGIKATKSNLVSLKSVFGSSVKEGREYKLRVNVDYTVAYQSNERAGKATVSIIGKGAFSGKISKTFQINKVLISSDDIQIKVVSDKVQQCKKGAKLDVEITRNCNGQLISLVEGRDFTIKYKNNNRSGDKAVAVINGIGSYSGSVSKNFIIEKKSLQSEDIDVTVSNVLAQYKKEDYLYKPEILVTDQEGKLKAKSDYEVDYSGCVTQDDFINGRTKGYVIIRGTEKGDYTGIRIVPYKVSTNSIAGSNCVITVQDQKYTGKAITFDLTKQSDMEQFEVTIELENGTKKKLVPGDDFEVVGYKNNLKCGKATVVLRGLENYCGTKQVTFQITKNSFDKQ